MKGVTNLRPQDKSDGEPRLEFVDSCLQFPVLDPVYQRTVLKSNGQRRDHTKEMSLKEESGVEEDRNESQEKKAQQHKARLTLICLF